MIIYMYLTFLRSALPFTLAIIAIKDMASNVERRWRQMVSNQEAGTKLPDANATEGGSR